MASPAVFEILGPKRIGITGLTFQGHVTSSVASLRHFLFGTDEVTHRLATVHTLQTTDRQTPHCSTCATVG